MARTFHFNAQAVAVAAQVDGPAKLDEVWAAVSLPIIGGKDTRRAGPDRHGPLLSFEAASATVEGRSSGAVHTTRTEVNVVGLDVLGIIRGDVQIVMRMSYDAGRDEYEVEFGPQKPFANLVVPGVATAAITFNGKRYRQALKAGRAPGGMGAAAAPDPEPCVLRCPGSFNSVMQAVRSSAPTKHHLHPHGVLLTSLVEPETGFQWDASQSRFGFTTVNGLGRVYFLEWAVEPYRQSLTALRIVLDDPAHAYRGEIIVADPEENGRPDPGTS
jgi:hypothetical protein